MANFVSDAQLTVSSSSVGFTTVGANVRFALIHVETASIRLGTAASAPTSTAGAIFHPGDTFPLLGNENCRNVRFIRDGSVDATLNVEFFDGYDIPFVSSGSARDDAGRVQVVGAVPSNDPGAGNPVLIGYVVDASSPTAVAEGDARYVRGNTIGDMAVTPYQLGTGIDDATATSGVVGRVLAANNNEIIETTRAVLMALAPDGAYDRGRMAGDAGGGLGALVVSPTGHDHKVIAADTQVAATASKLHTVTIHDITTGGTITIYDSAAESGTVIAVLTLAAGEGFVTLHYDVACGTGIYVGYDSNVVGHLTVSYAD